VTQSTAGSAVIQVKPGIGDVVWHFPFIRAIAAVSPGGCVSFLAPPTSGAKELLAAEPCIAETIYFEHSGSELRRGVNLIRLVALLRRHRFRTVWILDRTLRPAVAAMLAGIPERIGLGLGAQRFFITNVGVDYSHFHDHPIGWLRALMAAMNVPLPTTEPELRVPDDVLAAIDARYGSCARPWIVLGIGASDPQRDWPDASWSEFLAGLRRKTSGTVFLIGGRSNIARAQTLIDRGDGTEAINACDLTLGEALALLRRADLFVGTDSGPMNLALAAGTPAFALFGVNPVLNYSKFIHPVAPQGGPAPGGMLRISPATVLAQVTPYLASRKQPV
jgi:heptosyltransferase II